MNVVIRIHLASLHTVELNHKPCGVDLSRLTNNIRCRMMCLLEGVSTIILRFFVQHDYDVKYICVVIHYINYIILFYLLYHM